MIVAVADTHAVFWNIYTMTHACRRSVASLSTERRPEETRLPSRRSRSLEIVYLMDKQRIRPETLNHVLNAL